MLRTVGPRGSLFELLLPIGLRVLSGELADVDAVLDDWVFMGRLRRFSIRRRGGRRSRWKLMFG